MLPHSLLNYYQDLPLLLIPTDFQLSNGLDPINPCIILANDIQTLNIIRNKITFIGFLYIKPLQNVTDNIFKKRVASI